MVVEGVEHSVKGGLDFRWLERREMTTESGEKIRRELSPRSQDKMTLMLLLYAGQLYKAKSLGPRATSFVLPDTK